MTGTEAAEIAVGLAAVAGHGLDATHPMPREPLPEPTFAMLLTASGEHRVLGLLGEAVREGAFPVTDRQYALLEDGLTGQHAHGLRIERLLLDAVGALDGAGIDSRVLKGVALAHTVYPGPEWRVFADADLLAPSASFGAAIGVLVTALDASREVPELRPGFDERFGKEVLLRARGRLELDVHRTFVEGALGVTIELDDLFVPGDEFRLGSRSLAMLPAPQQLLHAAYAAVLGEQPPRLMSLRDVAQVLLVRAPDADEVVTMARRWRAEAVLARALTSAWAKLALSDQPRLLEWAASYSPGRRERMLLESQVAPNRAHTRHLAALLVIPGLRDRVAYARALAWPGADYLDARGFTRGSFARRAWRSLR